MNQPLLSIGIILALGSVGCAGLGVQHNSSFTAQHRAQRGVDDLWAEAGPAPTGADTPLYSEQVLGDLWDPGRETPMGVVDSGYDEERGADLWNPASVTRSWESENAPSGKAYRFSKSSGRSWYC